MSVCTLAAPPYAFEMLKEIIRTLVPRGMWTRLRMMRMRHMLASYKRRRVRHCYGGYELDVELVDPMSEGWYDHDYPELSEITLLKGHGLRPGATVFDIGAHQCVVAMMLSKTVGPAGRVVALEANADNCAAGEQNRKLNGIANLEIVHAAGAARSGMLVFNRGTNGQVDDGSGEWGQVQVKSYSVDDLATQFGVPDVLFIDVEGFECELLRGAQDTLLTRPDCFVEVHVNAGLEKFGGSVSQVLGLFPAGYEFFMAPPDQPFLPLDKESELLRDRFFLVAIAPRKSGAPQGAVSKALSGQEAGE